MINFPQAAGNDWRKTVAEKHGAEIPGQIDHNFFIDYASSVMGEDVSHVRARADERVKGTMAHPYNMRPLTQYKTPSAYKEKHDTVNLNPLTAGREDRKLWERTVGIAQRKNAWLDRYNADSMTGTDFNGNKTKRDVDAITMQEVRTNPTLARILAGFALQDGENVPYTMPKNDPGWPGLQVADNRPRANYVKNSDTKSPWSAGSGQVKNNTYASLLTANEARNQKSSKTGGLWGKIKSGLGKLKFW